MTLDWFPWHPTKFRRKTYHLSLAEDGAYRRLIDEYMITREPLPNDDAALARILGIPKAEWDCVATNVRAFFRARNDKLFHKHCEEELRAQEVRHNRNHDRAKKAAFARYSKINDLPAMRMLAPATLQDRRITTSEPRAARATPTLAPVEPQQALSDEVPVESPAVIAMRERLQRRKAAS